MRIGNETIPFLSEKETRGDIFNFGSSELPESTSGPLPSICPPTPPAVATTSWTHTPSSQPSVSAGSFSNQATADFRSNRLPPTVNQSSTSAPLADEGKIKQ